MPRVSEEMALWNEQRHAPLFLCCSEAAAAAAQHTLSQTSNSDDAAASLETLQPYNSSIVPAVAVSLQ